MAVTTWTMPHNQKSLEGLGTEYSCSPLTFPISRGIIHPGLFLCLPPQALLHLRFTNKQANHEQQGIGGHQKYASAFNDTMNKIWKEQIALLGVIGTDRFFRFRASARLTANGEFSGIQLSQILKEKSHGSLTL